MISKIHSNENNKVMLRGNINIDSMNNKENIDIYIYIYTYIYIHIRIQYAYTHTQYAYTHTHFDIKVWRHLQANGIPPAFVKHDTERHEIEIEWKMRQVRVKSVQGLFFTKRSRNLAYRHKWDAADQFSAQSNGDFLLIDPSRANMFPHVSQVPSTLTATSMWIYVEGGSSMNFHMGWIEFSKLHGQEDGSDCREWRLEGGHGTKLERDACSWVLVLCLWIFWV